MLHQIAILLKRLAREDHASEIAETAVVLPLAFTLLLSVFWFGQAYSIYGAITQAAREGARAGAAPTCSTCASGSASSLIAFNAVHDALVAAKLNPAKAIYPIPQPVLVSCSDGTPQACVGSGVCVQDSIQLSNTGSGGAGVCGISVSFQYPYQFRLPFTTIDNRLIYLQAQARMRSETR